VDICVDLAVFRGLISVGNGLRESLQLPASCDSTNSASIRLLEMTPVDRHGGKMTPDRALDYLNEMLWSAAVVAGPVMLATLLVGLVISIFQVATQIQEITLSYVPKIITAGLMMILLGSWMIGQLTAFARNLFLTIPSLGQ
jgi:flagellar biosynthetic protein FliQ